MTNTRYRMISLLLPAIYVVGSPLFSQNTKVSREFLIDVNRPFVYVKFDHIGPGAPRSEDEPVSRIWLRLTNNCRIPILVRANGVPDESPKYEVGVEYEIVPNPAKRAMVMFSRTPSRARKSVSEKLTDSQEAETKTEEVPRSYMEEVASLVTIEPGGDVLFSLPENHLSKRWHIEIPFEFDLPKGKGPRDPMNGGSPGMNVAYSLWDLPPKSQAELGKK